MDMQTSADADVIRAEDPEKEERILTAKDRCDRCNAQAFYLTLWDSGELMWCYHHFHENEEYLRKISYYIVDQSSDLK